MLMTAGERAWRYLSPFGVPHRANKSVHHDPKRQYERRVPLEFRASFAFGCQLLIEYNPNLPHERNTGWKPMLLHYSVASSLRCTAIASGMALGDRSAVREHRLPACVLSRHRTTFSKFPPFFRVFSSSVSFGWLRIGGSRLHRSFKAVQRSAA